MYYINKKGVFYAKNQVSKHYFHSHDGIRYGVRNDLQELSPVSFLLPSS